MEDPFAAISVHAVSIRKEIYLDIIRSCTPILDIVQILEAVVVVAQ